MSVFLRKFQELLTLQKIMTELDRELSIKDKTLAEFVLNLARSSKSVDHFLSALEENGADFSIDLVNTLYATITRQLKAQKSVEPAGSQKSTLSANIVAGGTLNPQES